jgi:hypothetical protein
MVRRRPALPFALILAASLAGCTTSSDRVVIEAPGTDSSPQSLSVAWAARSLRLDTLEAELSRTRQDLRTLCAAGARTPQPICARLLSVEDQTRDHTAALAATESAVVRLADRLVDAEATLGPISYDPRAQAIYFTGVDVHVRNGSGSTDGEPDGTGNLILGWNEVDDEDERTGSHNLVIGSRHTWTGHSGLISGLDNTLRSDASVAVGGQGNIVTGAGAAAIGGQDNEVAGEDAVAVGGAANFVEGEVAVASGGFGNDILGAYGVTVGGSELGSEDEGAVLVGTSLLGPAGELHPDYVP